MIPLVRLVDLPDDDSELGRAGRLARGALALPVPPAAARHEVRWRIRATLDGRRSLARRVLRPAVVALLLLSGGAVLGLTADRLLGHRHPAPTHRLPAPRPSPRPPGVVDQRTAIGDRSTGVVDRPPGIVDRPSGMVGQPPPIAAPPPAAVTRQGPPAVPRPARVTAKRTTAMITPPPSLTPPSFRPRPVPPVLPKGWRRDEQTLFAAALHQLRGVGDARAALATLDELARDFPGGMFAPEGASLRAAALAQLGRSSEALTALEGAGPPGPAALVVRGELHASLGQLSQAAADFGAVLDAGVPANPDDGPVLERALWGRAQVRARQDDRAGARADLQEYLRRFPSGRFAAAAERWMGRSR